MFLSADCCLSLNVDNKVNILFETLKKIKNTSWVNFTLLFFLAFLAESTVCNQEHILDWKCLWLSFESNWKNLHVNHSEDLMQSCSQFFITISFLDFYGIKKVKNHIPRKSMNYFSSYVSLLKRSFQCKLNNHSFLSLFFTFLWVYAFPLLGRAELRGDRMKLLAMTVGFLTYFQCSLLKPKLCTIKKKSFGIALYLNIHQLQ